MKTQEAIARILKREGSEFISLFPGTPASEMANACAAEGIKTINVRQERAAIGIADGYTRASNGLKNGVCAVGYGYGTSNGYPGVVQAHCDGVPVLIIGGGTPRTRKDLRATQDFDMRHNYVQITKWIGTINDPNRVPTLMRRAYTQLRLGKFGPVALELPIDLCGEELDDDTIVDNYRVVTRHKFQADSHDVEIAARAILAAKNPLIIAGEGVLYAEAWDELREFAELVQAPVMTTLKSKGTIPEDHPLSVGTGGKNRAAARAIMKTDLCFGVGASLTIGPGGAFALKDKKVVQVLIDEEDVNKDFMADAVVIGDAKLVLSQLIAEVKRRGEGKKRKGLIDELQQVKEKERKDWMSKFTSNEVPINPYRVIWDLMQTVDRKNTIVTHDSGMPREQLASTWETIIPRGYIGWGNFSTLGFGLYAMIGAKLAEPRKTCIAFMGDGAFGMTGLDFETAVRFEIPILVVIFNNSGMGTYFKHTPTVSNLFGNYAMLAEGMGGHGERVEKPDEIIPALKRARKAMDSGKPAILDVVTKNELESPATAAWAEVRSKI